MYPTAAKFVSGLVLAAVAFVVCGQIMAVMPEGTAFGMFVPLNVVFGLLVGWIWLGPRVDGVGTVAALSQGLTAALVLFVVALFAQGGNEMMRLAMLNRYNGPFEAIGAIFVESIRLARAGLAPETLATLALGGMGAGVLASWTARRFS